MSQPPQQGYGAPGSVPPGLGASREHNEQLRRLWNEMKEEIYFTEADPAQFKSQTLPLARIKKIMKSDEDVRMISAEAPVLFAKARSRPFWACELFILELTQRAWQVAEESKRRTLLRSDVAAAIQRVEIFDFLLDIVPFEESEAGDERGSSTPAISSAPTAQPMLQHQAQPMSGCPTTAQGPPEPLLAQEAHRAASGLDATPPSFSEYLRPPEPSAEQQHRQSGEAGAQQFGATVRFPEYQPVAPLQLHLAPPG